MAATAKQHALVVSSGHRSEKGVRPSMEDEVFIKENFNVNSTHLGGKCSFYAVFDGHGGRAAAIYTRDHLFQTVYELLSGGTEPSNALKQAFLQTDQTFIQQFSSNAHPNGNGAGADGGASTTPSELSHVHPQHVTIATSEKDTSGTTAVAVLIDHERHHLYVAHVGDSRAILINRSGAVVSLTIDHKADRPDEVQRIRSAGGFVVHKRVMGELAVSRAIGDCDFKEKGFQFVLAEPELGERNIAADDDVLLLACDGLYDVMTNDNVGEFVREKMSANGLTPEATAKLLVDHAIDHLYTRDNVTVIIVKLNANEQADAPAAAAQTATSHPTQDTRQHATSTSSTAAPHNAVKVSQTAATATSTSAAPSTEDAMKD